MSTTKTRYVDGFVLMVPTKNTAAYKKMATEARKIWKKFGALDYKECIADSLSPEMGGMKSWGFKVMTKVKDDETIWFSYITYKSKKHRDEVNKKVMTYFEKKYAKAEMQMPFDMKRFAYGGFTVAVGA